MVGQRQEIQVFHLGGMVIGLLHSPGSVGKVRMGVKLSEVEPVIAQLHRGLVGKGVHLSGLGFGLSTPLFNSLVVSKSTAERKGLNASLCTMAMFSGQFLSAMLVSFIAGRSLFATAAIIAAVIGVCILPVQRHFDKRR